jgi:hypothetical protein
VNTRFRWSVVTAIVGVLTCVPVSADSPADSASSALVAQLSRYATQGDVPIPALDPEDVRRLLTGEPVVDISLTAPGDDAEGGARRMGVVGVTVVEAPRLLVWLTAMGAASEPDVRLTRAMLSTNTDGSYIRYQHVNLPWPIRDRHWVIYCEKNIGVAENSGGEFWEHRWSLIDDGESLLPQVHEDGLIPVLSTRQLDRSIYLPANRGAWVLSELAPDRTLVIAWFDGDFGGLFPDSLVRRFTRTHLREGLRLVAELSASVHTEYDMASRLIYDGFGQPITEQDARDAASAATTELATTE